MHDSSSKAGGSEAAKQRSSEAGDSKPSGARQHTLVARCVMAYLENLRDLVPHQLVRAHAQVEVVSVHHELLHGLRNVIVAGWGRGVVARALALAGSFAPGTLHDAKPHHLPLRLLLVGHGQDFPLHQLVGRVAVVQHLRLGELPYARVSHAQVCMCEQGA